MSCCITFVLLSRDADGHFSQDESSEEFLGEWMESRGNRDRMFIATKVPLSYCSLIADH